MEYFQYSMTFIPPKTAGSQKGCLTPDICVIAIHSCKFLLYGSLFLPLFKLRHWLPNEFHNEINHQAMNLALAAHDFPLHFVLSKISFLTTCICLMLSKWSAKLECLSTNTLFNVSTSLPKWKSSYTSFKYKIMLGHETFSFVLHGSLSLCSSI